MTKETTKQSSPEFHPAVLALARDMQFKLDKNERKPCDKMMLRGAEKRTWEHCTIEWLRTRILDEWNEMRDELGAGDWRGAQLECADIANFAMMIHDNLGRRIAATPMDRILKPERTYVALPRNFKNRGPIVFRGCRRKVVGTDHSNDNYFIDDQNVDSCWPFNWESLQPGEQCLAIGFNDNCGTGYLIYELNDAGRYKLSEWLVGKYRHIMIDDIGDRLILQNALADPDSKFLGEDAEDLLIHAGKLKIG